jgi:hypothetical protein
MNLNRLLLIGAVLMSLAALAVALDGRLRPIQGTRLSAPTKAGDPACGCADPVKKTGTCGAGCCGGAGGKSSGGCAVGLGSSLRTASAKK